LLERRELLTVGLDGAFKFSSPVQGTEHHGDYTSMGAIANDGQGNTYIAGSVTSPNSLESAGPLDLDPTHSYDDNRDLVYGSSPYGSAGFIVKYDAAGQFQWVQASTSLLDDNGVPHGQGSGGSEMTIMSMEIAASGNVYFAGNYTGSSAFGGQTLPWTQYNGNGDGFVGMIQPDGTVGWLKGYNFAEVERSSQLTVDEAGQRVYVVGSQALTNGTSDPSVLVTAFNFSNPANIAIAWQAPLVPKTTNGVDATYGNDIALDHLGNVIVVGRLIGQADFDPSGGTLSLSSGSGRFDRPEAAYIWKLTASQGRLVWAQLFDGGKASADLVTIDATNNIYVGGSFSGTVDFQWGKASLNLSSTGGKDAYVAKLSPTGTTSYAKKFGGASDDLLSDMLLDAQGNIYVSITHWSSSDISTGASILKLNNSGSIVSQIEITGRIAQFSPAVKLSLNSTTGRLNVIGSFIGALDADSDGVIDLVGQDTGYAWEFDGFWLQYVGL
jgi:hypothetical protein